MTEDLPPPTPHQVVAEQAEHPPMRPLWLCRHCGQPWPCTRGKLALLADYEGAPVNLFMYLAGCLHEAINDLHRLDPCLTGSAADMFDRFLGWPTRLNRCYRVTRMSERGARPPTGNRPAMPGRAEQGDEGGRRDRDRLG